MFRDLEDDIRSKPPGTGGRDRIKKGDRVAWKHLMGRVTDTRGDSVYVEWERDYSLLARDHWFPREQVKLLSRR